MGDRSIHASSVEEDSVYLIPGKCVSFDSVRTICVQRDHSFPDGIGQRIKGCSVKERSPLTIKYDDIHMID